MDNTEDKKVVQIRDVQSLKERFEEFYSDWNRQAIATAECMGKVVEIHSTTAEAFQLQHTLSQSIKQIADTYVRAERRQERLENKYAEASDTLAGKGQIPLKSHYITVAMVALPSLLITFGVIVYILYISKFELNASLTSIQLQQQKTQQDLARAKDEVVQRVEQAAEAKK